MANPLLLLASALFFLGLSALLYLASWLTVYMVWRLLPGLSPSNRKRYLFWSLVLPPVIAGLLTSGGALLRHIHAPGMEHHNAMCGDVYRLLTAPQGSLPTIAGVLLSGGAWMLLISGTIGVLRLTNATALLSRGLTPYLKASSPRLAAAVARVQSRTGICNLPFYESDRPMGYSCLVGLRRVRCVLSKELVASCTEGELEAIVTHEANHFLHGDIWFSYLIGVINCVFFFLRPVRLMSRRWREEMELACDAATVAATGKPLLLASAILRTQGIPVSSHSLPAVALGFAEEMACTSSKRIERLLVYAQQARIPVDTSGHSVWQWMVTLLLASLGVSLLLSPQILCTAHCSLEAIARTLH